MVLVTGASGFIGRHLVQRLLEDGTAVRVITRRRDGLPELWNGKVDVVSGDLTDKRVAHHAMHGISKVFHLAAELRDSKKMTAVNVEATGYLGEAATESKVPRFIHLSSVGVMGAGHPGVVTEQTVCRPRNPYEESKLAGEEAALRTVAQGLVVLRPTNVFGEGQHVEPKSFSEWLRAIEMGRMINLGRDSVANYVYVGDVVDTMVRLGGLPLSHGEVFIVNDPVPMVEFVAAAADALEVPVPSRRAPMWLVFPIAALLQTAHHVLRTPAPLTIQRVKALATRTCFSADKLNSVTGTPMRFGYRQGLQRTVQAYRAQKRAA